MSIIAWNILTTAPTPVKSTLRASHMHASWIFLNGNLTLWTSMSSNFISPTLIHLFLSYLAWLSLMPISTTIKAKVFAAVRTLDLSGWLCSLHHFGAFWVRAKLFISTEGYYMIFLKLFKFQVCLPIDYPFQEIITDLLSAPLLWAL